MDDEEQKNVVEKAKHYLDLLGEDSVNRLNAGALAMAIGWKIGKNKKDDSTVIKDVSAGAIIMSDGIAIGQMIGSAAILALECETLEEAFLE